MTLFNKLIILSLLIGVTVARSVVNDENIVLDNIEDSLPNEENIVSNNTEGSLPNEENSISNNTEGDVCNCNHRYFQHYAVKGCVVEEEDSCGCPKKFTCPPQNQTSVNNVCVFKSKEYPVGTQIPTPNICRICWCRDGGEGPHMSCVSQECFNMEQPIGENCVLAYEGDRCCPVGYKCSSTEFGDENKENQTCEYEGILYPFGSRIYPKSDNCRICTCDENWKENNFNCRQIDCLFETRNREFEAGCIPVYHEKVCCPIEFYCPPSHNFSYSLVLKNETGESEIAIGDKCTFGDQQFNIGDVMPTDNSCITCTCLVPPELTCIHRTCPPSPSEEHCMPNFKPDECCPSYDCLFADAEPYYSPDVCPTPLCADSSCRIETPPGHRCPTCVCGGRYSELEHNNVQQQTQEISMNVEPFQETFIGNVNNDFSVEQLQLMPIRMATNSEEELTAIENVFEPQSEDDKEDSEREINPSDENFSEIEPLNEPGDFLENDEDNLVIESELNDPELNIKEVEKRSEIPQEPTQQQFEISKPIQQEQMFVQSPGEIDDIEREGSEIEKGEETFEDELESFRRKLFTNDSTINEILNIDHVVEVSVPPGCPTPLCEGPWCKIGIPQGHTCPTCICKRPSEP